MNADCPPLLVITNAAAGLGGASTRDERLDGALELLRSATDVRVAACSHPRELNTILLGRENRRIVIVGGDGSLNHAVATMLRRRQLHADDPIGLLPGGTGNDLARTLGLPLDLEEAAKVVLTGRPRPLDVLVDDVNGVVINCAHVGAGAEAAVTAEGLKPTLGSAAYSVGGLIAGMRTRGWRLRILVDDAVLWDSLAGADLLGGTDDDDDLVLMVALGNGRTVGGGVPLTPEAEPDDGLIDVVVSVATGPMARVAYAGQMVTGSHLERGDVHTAKGRRVTVLSQESSFPVNVDGEIQTGVHGRTWHVRHAAWSVLVPSDTAL